MKNQKGFGAIEALLLLVIVGMIGGTGFYVYNANKEEPKISDSSIQQKDNSEELLEEELSESYLVVKEWGLRFKIPDNLTDVQYKISGDTLGVFAKPVKDKNGQPFDVEYPSDYGEVDKEYGGFYYSQGNLIRSKNSTEDIIAGTQKGKKLGDYYYYTSYSFSGLASGAGPNGIFFDEDCKKDDQQKKCDRYYLAESIVFAIINGTSLHPETDSEVEDALLPSIELTQ